MDMDASLDPIAALRSEHEAVRAVLSNLEGYLKKINSVSSGGLRNNLINQLNGITSFMDKDLETHFKKEEEALFPVLGNYIGIETGPIHVMLIEHKHSRELSEEFKIKINNYPAGGDFKSIIEIGGSFARLLSEHIEKEESILFNMADMQLSKEEKQGIMEKMRSVK